MLKHLFNLKDINRFPANIEGYFFFSVVSNLVSKKNFKKPPKNPKNPKYSELATLESCSFYSKEGWKVESAVTGYFYQRF